MWNLYWDNIGFDGPPIRNTREYEIINAGIPSTRTAVDEYQPHTTVHNRHSLGHALGNRAVVGTGTAASCTTTAYNTAMQFLVDGPAGTGAA